MNNETIVIIGLIIISLYLFIQCTILFFKRKNPEFEWIETSFTDSLPPPLKRVMIYNKFYHIVTIGHIYSNTNKSIDGVWLYDQSYPREKDRKSIPVNTHEISHWKELPKKPLIIF